MNFKGKLNFLKYSIALDFLKNDNVKLKADLVNFGFESSIATLEA